MHINDGEGKEKIEDKYIIFNLFIVLEYNNMKMELDKNIYSWI